MDKLLGGAYHDQQTSTPSRSAVTAAVCTLELGRWYCGVYSGFSRLMRTTRMVEVSASVSKKTEVSQNVAILCSGRSLLPFSSVAPADIVLAFTYELCGT